ncbi:MAG: heat shock protein HspQ [Brevundimonas sp.]|nr:MAG: heat shock protein HspQ [Brevundimonas sp.]
MTRISTALFRLGQVVRHRDGAFRGVVIDADAAYAGPPSETGTIASNQPFYQVYALGQEGGFIAYAAESVIEADPDQTALTRRDERTWFTVDAGGHHAPRTAALH